MLCSSLGDPTVLKTMKLLQSAHYANSSYNNSANIVKLGIKYEDAGELVRALKMYTIAYRIRREALSPAHPSLVVILNMLGSIQIKRGELDEAMAIYELALKDTEPVTSPGGNSSGDDNNSIYSASGGAANVSTNFVTRAVTYREMGTIYEQWGEADRALRMYHKSLDCMAEYKGLKQQNHVSTFPWEAEFSEEKKEDDGKMHGHNEILNDLEATHLTSNSKGARFSKSQPQSSTPSRRNDRNGNLEDPLEEENGMELTFGDSGRRGRKGGLKPMSVVSKSRYDIFFPQSLEEKKRKNLLPVGGGSKKNRGEEQCLGDHTDVDVALTIHRIAQLHRARQEYHHALPAFYVSLRGMKFALGKSHPNVAAILGNIGNLQKEMGDMDSAYTTYQQVLAIESYRLGLSHPDVVVTLHNISTIDAARGNLDHALSLYTQVVSLQRKLFGEDHESVAVTSACMGDVYERLGDIKSAVECYEEALRIKIAALGRHSLEVARLLHKLGKLAVCEEDFHLAHSYISKAILVYRLNKLRDDDEWVIDVHRDAADVDAAIAMGRGGDICEC
jgi:tetratricopeptide (TPR) repeat protein